MRWEEALISIHLDAVRLVLIIVIDIIDKGFVLVSGRSADAGGKDDEARMAAMTRWCECVCACVQGRR